MSARAIIVLGGLAIALTALGLCIGVRVVPQYGFYVLLVLAPVTILALAFPVQQALTVNQESEKLSLKLASEIIPNHVADVYAQRGAHAAAMITAAGTNRASAIVEHAKASAQEAISRAKVQATSIEHAATIHGAKLYSLVSPDYLQLNASCDVVEPMSLRIKCVQTIDAGSARLKRVWEQQGDLRGQPPRSGSSSN